MSFTDFINKNENVSRTDIENAKMNIVVEIIEYLPNAVVNRTIFKKSKGKVTVMSFNLGEELGEKTSPYETYIQIIDSSAEIVIDKKKYQLKQGNSIVIPAHVLHCINANEQFKMISTIIKAEYE